MATKPAWEYLPAVLRHWVAFVTGSLPIAVYTTLVLGFPDIPGQSHHWWNHLPQWLVFLLAILGLIAAQFMAWLDMRAARDPLLAEMVNLRGERDNARGERDNARGERDNLKAELNLLIAEQEVFIDPRLELLEEIPGLRPPDSKAEIRDMEALGLQPEPDHTDTVRLRTKAEIDPPLLDIGCTGPIYSVVCFYHLPNEELMMMSEPLLRKPDRILMQLGEKPIPADTRISLQLFSPAPLRLKGIKIGRR